ncbi:hypothetical protein [uncultured Roseobacter sp.]|uniref:plasmid mobilization protein n=1 Tax=uncultured Roseobacter sp. TaxID=114847 RepID=UPI0026321A9D|nr:hypothetical protein [uncultured Roseobacter sp.]
MTEFKDIATQDTLRLTPEMLAATQQAALQKKTTPPPFSIRFTFEERARLKKAAAGMPLGAYIRQKLFEGELTQRRTRGKNPVKDHTELARVLGALGASRLSSNLNQIAKAAHLGALPVTPELEEELGQACRDIRNMRTDLMKALGFPDAEGPS